MHSPATFAISPPPDFTHTLPHALSQLSLADLQQCNILQQPTYHYHITHIAASSHISTTSHHQQHMAPPWVTFDSVAYYNGSCANGAEPDIAGVGVRTIISHLSTTACTNDPYPGRPIFRHRKRHDDHRLHFRHVPRPGLRFQRPLQTQSAAQIHTRALPRHGMEARLRMATFFGSTHHRSGRSAAHHGLRRAAQWMDKGTKLNFQHPCEK